MFFTSYTRNLTAAALIGYVLLAGCTRHGEEAKATGDAVEQADVPLKFQALNIGSAVLADQSVVPMSIFRPADTLIASVQTTSAGSNVPVEVRLISMSNGQLIAAAERTVTASAAHTTNLELKTPGPLPVGRYQIEARIAGDVKARQEIDVRTDGPPAPMNAIPEAVSPDAEVPAG